MGIGEPGLLEKFIRVELRPGKNVLKLDNMSRRPTNPNGFQHVGMDGTLEVNFANGVYVATVNVDKAKVSEWDKKHLNYNAERIKRIANSAYQVELTGALAYDPGKRITLYSYLYDEAPGWSFHCVLPRVE